MVLGHDVLTSERTQDIKISEDVSFDSMLLSPNTLAGLKISGFYVPSPIQLHGIPLGKCGFDLLLEAKSGTGKTAVFSIIALEKLSLNIGVQSIILAPTREIAFQICDVIKTIGSCYKGSSEKRILLRSVQPCKGLCVEVVMGGLPFADDVQKLKKNVHIIVGSPGRLHYLIKGKHIDVSSVRLMVLDEADKLVEKTFLPDINYIFSVLPSQKQIIMSSATYPENVKLLLNKYLQNAHHICPDSNSLLLGIDQNIILVSDHINIERQTKNRYEELNQILCKKQFKQCLIFCNYQVRVCEVHRTLNRDKWPADKLHGQQEQADRLDALKILQSYQCRILVTTDLAARGIDASNVDLVINFEPPYDWQTYLHRIGRAGRYGSYGNAVTIICKGDEENKFQKILQSINIPFNLKYFWSGEPYLLEKGNIDDQTNLKKEHLTHKENKKIAQKLGVKEIYEQLWNMLSEEITDREPIDGIPSFESLNKSFQGSKEESNVNVIESFSDLLSSFQNHGLQSKEHLLPMYKPVAVNKLIIPSMMFNRNDILQSIQTNSGMSAVEEEVEDKKEIINYAKLNSFKSRESTNDKNTVRCNNSLRKSTKDSTPNKNWQSTYNFIEKCSTDIHSETSCSSSDILTPNAFKSHCQDSKNVQNPVTKRNEFYNNTQNEIFCGSDDNSNNGEFNIESDNHNKYNENQKALIAANLPPAFGKIKNKICKKSKKHNVDLSKSNNKESKHKVQMQESVPLQEYGYSSSDDENTETNSALKWKRSSPRNYQDLNTSMNDQRSSDYNKNKICKESKKHNVDLSKLNNKESKHKVQMQESVPLQEYGYSSADDENTETNSALKWKRSSPRNYQDLNTSMNDQRSSDYNKNKICKESKKHNVDLSKSNNKESKHKVQMQDSVPLQEYGYSSSDDENTETNSALKWKRSSPRNYQDLNTSMNDQRSSDYNKNKICKESKKHNVDFSKSYSKESKHEVQMQESVQPQEYAYSSSDDKNTETISALKWKRSSQRNYQDLNTSMNDQRSSDYNNREMEEREQEFNVWLQQLQFHRQMIEQSVYIQLMGSSYH